MSFVFTMPYPIHFYHDPGPGRPTLLIGHGNGFPPAAYAPLARAMGEDYRQVCLPARPWWGTHSPDNIRDWHFLSEDMIGGIQEHALGPVVGLGHSMSGVAMVYAAVQRPDLFRAIVLIDPVFLPPAWLWLARLLKPFGFQTNKRLVEGARKRKRDWASVDEAYERFRGRSLFKNCSDEVVRLYAEGLLQPTGRGGMELAYPVEWEVAIFAHGPLDEWNYPPRLKTPCLIIGGEASDTFLPPAIAAWRKRRPDVQIELVPNTGHLIPMEAPEAIAQLSHKFLASLRNSPS
jgi:pimeloyl-ACP methyl ester carboxylesterase